MGILGDFGRLTPDTIGEYLPGIIRLPFIVLAVLLWGVTVAFCWLFVPKIWYKKMME